MVRNIYGYLDQYHVPPNLSGYGLLVRLIQLSLEGDKVSIETHMETLAKDTGVSSARIRGRIRYALTLSSIKDEPGVKGFVCTAVNKLQQAEHNYV